MKTWLSFASAAYVLSGCVTTIEHHGHGDSTLSVEWTIDGSDHPAACDDNGVAYAYVQLDSHDGFSDAYEVDCDAFGIDIDLPAGRYWVTVVLRDRHHDDVTTPVETDPRDLGFDDSDFVSVDFGADSFL